MMLLQLSEPSGIVEDGNGDAIFMSINMSKVLQFLFLKHFNCLDQVY